MLAVLSVLGPSIKYAAKKIAKTRIPEKYPFIIYNGSTFNSIKQVHCCCWIINNLLFFYVFSLFISYHYPSSLPLLTH